MELKDTIERFIQNFSGATDTFLHGCCYWFAILLRERFLFSGYEAIMYEPVEGHFVTRVDGRYYDIRGDVTDMYHDKSMYDMWTMYHHDNKYWKRLMRDCRDFLPPNEE